MLLYFLGGCQPDARRAKKEGDIKADVPKACGVSMIRHQEHFQGLLMILELADGDRKERNARAWADAV